MKICASKHIRYDKLFEPLALESLNGNLTVYSGQLGDISIPILEMRKKA